MRLFILAGCAATGLLANAAARELPTAWAGSWSGGEGRDVRLVVDPAGKSILFVDGVAFEIVSSQVSPDKRTVIAYWGTGEGAFARSDDGSLVASLFDRRFPIRMVKLEKR